LASEYIFFDEALSSRFAGFAATLGLTASIRPDRITGCVVSLPENLPDDIDDRLEREYDALMEEQRQLVEADEGESGRQLMGVAVTLPDGRECLVRLPAAFGRRLCEHFTPQEIHDLVSAIAREIADPVSGPLCRNT
jgi:hypothetical protein